MTGSYRSLPKKRLPGYLHHKPSGLARVRIDGTDFYLGPYMSPESRQKYGELIARHASGLPIDPLVDVRPQPQSISIHELTLAFLRHADTYYRKNGRRTAEYDCFKSAIAPLVELYGSTSAADFGPLALKAVRQRMVDSKRMCRTYINKSVIRIRGVFRWGVENELVEPAVLQKLQAVAPLLAGRTTAIDHPKRKPVPEENIAAVREIVPEEVRDLIDLELYTGARPGELLMLTSDMIDRSGDVWIAQLEDHKNLHHGKSRILVFGPRSQPILTKYLSAPTGSKIFSYSRDRYGRTVGRACTTLGIERWTPHWLRHNAASDVREKFGLDAAQCIMGHSSPNMTLLYAHVDTEKAVSIARTAG